MNNNNSSINIDHSYDDVDFNNKDPLFFSSGNEYMYRAEEHEDEDDEDYENESNDTSNIKRGGAKKNKNEFSIDGFDENSESLVRGGYGNGKGDKEEFIKQFGTKILLFVGLALITILLICLGLYYYAKDHNSPLVNYIHPTQVIIISFDGFRWDYLNRGITPNIEALINDGSFRANYTTPQFPSKTFPNHYSIATGLFPEYHGIVSNHMYDRELNRTFNVGGVGSNDRVWYHGTPIWQHAEQHGIKTACYFWPGCNVEDEEFEPTHNKNPFSMKVNSSDILTQVYNWTQLEPSEKPYLTMVYIHEVDDAGHKYGPNSQEVNSSIAYFDKQIGVLVERLKQSNQYNSTNLIILSDHGMTEVSQDRTLVLTEISGDASFNENCFIPDVSPFLSIFTITGGKTDIELYESLAGKNTSLKVYLRKDIPSEYNLSFIGNNRIPDIIGIAELGWTVVRKNKSELSEKGNHGFEPHNQDMKSIFIGHGPNIKSNLQLSQSTPTNSFNTFVNTEIFNLVSTLLNIKSTTNNNGTNLLSSNFYQQSNK